ncbi:4-carboxy-4-hydroxy-2-oxoadipate aldolase/oxaloacetate decarboxylase [Virgibacillus ndiopensis]|uniref:4-carboxy-4-hydroxy-2-oxoadipate aldolase/oxaloacetate decarboxylase n=1 Tax=Virgibacillus ndiopensis TaxID=2004408 RepID=UPI000C07587F|nr:4-carboxy-4-hydroxy-2-oxoadipate aldolase/oxaloacetate decarboxylase [Virgibacillus ndiopensis]
MKKYIIKNIKRPDNQLIEDYAKYDVSTVYEAQGKTGLMSYELQTISQGDFVVGPAVTATCFAGDNLMIHAAIEVCRPGDILVVSIIGESNSGMIGELIVSALIKRGVKGLIINAGIRDVAQIRRLGFPVWSRAIYSQGTTKNKGGWVNKETSCGGCIVRPGDLIMADDDGVVVIEKANFERTLEASAKRVNKEIKTKEKIMNGELSLDFYGLREVLNSENVVYFEDEEQLTNQLTKSSSNM